MNGKFVGSILARKLLGERLLIVSNRTRARELILKKRPLESK